MRVVLDANVYLSAIPRLRDQDSPPRRIIGAWLAGAFDVVISDHIIDEVARNLLKPWFIEAVGDIDPVAVFEEIRDLAEVVNVQHLTGLPSVASHQEDDYLLATVIAGDADILVTGDRQLQRLGTYGDARILSPKEMLELLLD